jgi:DNA-binding MarR family transcriptional regulator
LINPSGRSEHEFTNAPPSPAATLDVLLLAFRLQGQLSSLLAQESKEYGLGPAEAVALIALTRGAEPISGVARASGIRPNGASVLVERLRLRGLVRRERSKRDSRIVTVELTDEGKAAADKLIERVGDQMRFVLSPLPSVERENLILLLNRLVGP